MTLPKAQLKCPGKAFTPVFREHKTGEQGSALKLHDNTGNPLTSEGTRLSITRHKVHLLKNLEGGGRALCPAPSPNQTVLQPYLGNV